MRTVSQVVILSAELSTKRFESNRQRTETLEGMLNDCNFRFKKALGCYKGSSEDSFVVVLRDAQELETLKDFAFTNFEQESILYQDANQEAYLVFANGKTEQLGRLEQVDKKEATSQEAFTVMGGNYYVTRAR